MRFAPVTALARSIANIDLNRATEAALGLIPEAISDLNRAQLKHGQRADLSFLPDYSTKSVEKYGKTAGPIKLFDKGNFYAGISPKFAPKEFEMIGTDEKTEYLQYHAGFDFEGYGENILGLSKDSIGDLAQDALPNIQSELRKQI